MPPLVSVVLPFYDNEATVREAVESVLGQTWTDLELIAVDDGSRDGSFQIVAELARSDHRIRLLRQANAGAAAARNAGVAAARGRYCAFQDADDLWLPRKLELQLERVGDRTLVFSDARFQDVTVSDPSEEYSSANLVLTPSVLLPTALVREMGGFDESMSGFSDWDFWLRLELAGVSFDSVSEPLIVVRRRTDSISSDWVTMWTAEARLLVRHARRVSLARRGPLRRQARIARKAVEVFLRKQAWRSVLAGDTHAARRDLVGSLRARPYSPRAWLALALALWPAVARRVVRGRI